MTIPIEDRDRLDHLRRRAEEAMRGKPVDIEGLPVEDIQHLLHELQVYQAELSIQNDELRRIQLELEGARDLYSDLYNFAPAGYSTLDQKDHIQEANQTLATMLGIDRKKLIGTLFSQYVDSSDQDKYYLHRQRALDAHQPHISEIRLVKASGEKLDVRLESVVARGARLDGSRIRVMISDITGLRQLEKEAQETGVQREVQHRMFDQREQERQQVARDLHDGPIQGLLAILFDLHGIQMDHPSSELAQRLGAVQADLVEKIGELRDYAMELRPPTLSKFGLELTIRSHADLFRKKHPLIRLRLEMIQTGPLIPETISVALFRIYQEALTNVIRHAQSTETEIIVRLEKDEHQVRLEIEDNGPGVALPDNWIDLVREGHLGLMGMRERAEAVGGTLEIQSKIGEGTRVLVNVPLGNPAAR